MTKTKPKRSITKASSSNVSDTKTSTPKNEQITLVVLGFDEQQKPCGARFVGDKPELVAKAADLMGLKVYKATTPVLLAIAKRLPLGRLYANGRGFVPNVRQVLYSDVVVELNDEPKLTVLGSRDDKASLPTARGLPRNWDEIAPGHLVIAQESLDYGWWEAIVLRRDDDMFTLRYREFPKLPKFVRHRTAIALMSPPSDQA
jgi:hypothetical protein